MAEWHHASYTSTIADGYLDQTPLVLHLKPFTDNEVLDFLSHHLGTSRAAEVQTHFEQLGLTDWLGSPQTLDLICTVAAKGALPQTRAELFDVATRKLAAEHNHLKAHQQIPIAHLLSAAGAACAALLLCGKAAIVRKPHTCVEDDELPLPELIPLPNGSDIGNALNTKLFNAHGVDQFGYMHRRIGEYLAAQWLAQHANTDRKRHRLLSMFQQLGMVPASLRGLYAWLAHSSHLAPQVIAFDPIAVLEYGATDDLPAHQARLLLKALERVTEANPRQWHLRSLKARCFAQADLTTEVQHWITRKDPDMVWLRVLVLESLEGSPISQTLAATLTTIITDAKDIYAARSAAFHALASLFTASESRALVDLLAIQKDEDALRLALEIAHHQGFEKFQASVLADICIAYALTASSMGAKFFYVKYALPNAQLLDFLDALNAGLAQIGKNQGFEVTYEIKNLAFALIAKAVDAKLPTATQVLQWFSALEDLHFAGGEEMKKLNTALLNTPELRQEILKTILIEQSTKENLRQQYIAISHYPSALHPSESDLVDLLESLPADDERWQELVLYANHDQGNGANVRQIAHKFVRNSPSGQAWLEQLTAPRPKYEWEVQQEAYEAKRKAEQLAERSQRITWHTERIDDLNAGKWEACWQAAAIYVLGQYGASHQDAPPLQRLQESLPHDLAQAALAGFESHLLQPLTSPTLLEITEGYAAGTLYRKSYIVIAGLLERLRNGRGIEDLSDELILSAFFYVQAGHFSEQLGIQSDALNTCICEALIQRNLLEKGVRHFYEAQLIANVKHLSNLYEFLHNDVFSSINTALVQEWLQRFQDLSPATETQFIDHLIRMRAMDALHAIGQQRPNPHPNSEQHCTWQTIRFLTDFEATAQQLQARAVDVELIWELRDRSQLGHYARSNKPLIWSTAQYVWVFENFRTLWPFCARPNGTTSGSHNPWQATEFLQSIAQQLANTTTPDAITALQSLRDAPKDGYTELLQSLCEQQMRKLCEHNYVPVTLDALQSIANDAAPRTIQDLQSWVVEELHVVQAKIRANDVDSWRGFYTDGGTTAHGEDRCRDHLLELLRQGAHEVSYAPEKHVAGDKEVDISCRVGALCLPIELKGQWHREVWGAADKQLARLYTTDWQADGCGIYVVLWFGAQTGGKALQSPGKQHHTPATADEMQHMLMERSTAAQSGKVAIVVLDISRPASAEKNPCKATRAASV